MINLEEHGFGIAFESHEAIHYDKKILIRNLYKTEFEKQQSITI